MVNTDLSKDEIASELIEYFTTIETFYTDKIYEQNEKLKKQTKAIQRLRAKTVD